MDKKVVITGGAGFIGSQLGFFLKERGYNNVVLLDNMYHGYVDNLMMHGELFPNIVFEDIRSENLGKHFEGADAVFHFAGMSSLPECMDNPVFATDVNVNGTINVLEQARLHGVKKVVFSSTSAIYENTTQFPTHETDNSEPNLLYCVSKKQAEMACHSFIENYGMNVIIMRYYNVYGPHMDFKRPSPPFVSYVVRELLNGRQPLLFSKGEASRDYVFVDDVNEMHYRILQNDSLKSGTTFNAGSGQAYTVPFLYDILKKHIGTDIEPEYGDPKKFWSKYPNLSKGTFPIHSSIVEKEVHKNTLADISNAKNLLDWEPQIDIQTGLKRCVDFVRQMK